MPDPTDGRRVLNTLTPRQGIDPGDAALVLSVLSRMIATLDPPRSGSAAPTGSECAS